MLLIDKKWLIGKLEAICDEEGCDMDFLRCPDDCPINQIIVKLEQEVQEERNAK